MKRGTILREFMTPEKLRVEIVGGSSDVSLRAHAERKVRMEIAYVVYGWGRGAEAREHELLSDPPLALRDEILRVGPEPEGVALDYTLFLPPEAEVEVEVGSGDVSAHGLAKTLRVTTGSGDVVLREVSGEVRVRCGSGDVELKRVFAALSICTGSGDITAHDIKGDLDLETGSGDVRLTEVQAELRISAGSGDVWVAGGLEEETWKIRTGSGDVDLRLPEGINAELLLRTELGDIACAFPVSAGEIGQNRVIGHVGQSPKARILVETGSGDINLHRAGKADRE